MAKATALKWITKEAKRLRRKYPKRFNTWRKYVSQAAAIYSSKHAGRSPIGTKRKKRVARSRQRKISGSADQPFLRHHAAGNKIGKVKRRPRRSITSHLSAAKTLIIDKISHLEGRKFVTKGKRNKNKISKQLSVLKTRYRRLKND